LAPAAYGANGPSPEENNLPRLERQMTTALKSNEAAPAAFMAGKTEIDALLARVDAASDDHFGVNPERLTWADAGSLGFVTERLKEIAGFLGGLKDRHPRRPRPGAGGLTGSPRAENEYRVTTARNV